MKSTLIKDQTKDPRGELQLSRDISLRSGTVLFPGNLCSEIVNREYEYIPQECEKQHGLKALGSQMSPERH